MYSQSLLVALLSLCAIPSTAAELQTLKTSQRTRCEFPDHSNVTIEYGNSRLKGRKVFGGLVPYGRPWETGYNRSTTFTTNADLVVGGKEVTPGQYIISTIPGPEKWTMDLKRVSSEDSRSGTDETAGIDLLVRRLPSPLENFTISFDQYPAGCVLNLRWERTEASVLVARNK